MKLENNNSIRLCGGRSCCPLVTKEEDGYTITDDYGGSVKLTFDEMRMIKDPEFDILMNEVVLAD